jgi:uncharacterized protein YutE (UPF0331/DUF86 family)
MDQERLAILKAEINAQIREIEKIYNRIAERKRKRSKSGIESLGYQLHNLYCAFEDLFKIVADTFENQIQDKSQYHIELLKRMTIAIEEVRPSLLSQDAYRLLDNLRAFRHFFRHAYTYELDERKVKIVLEDTIKLKRLYKHDIKVFLDSFEE